MSVGCPRGWGWTTIPCNVRVMDCSNLSSSSVSVNCLDIDDPGRDMCAFVVVWEGEWLAKLLHSVVASGVWIDALRGSPHPSSVGFKVQQYNAWDPCRSSLLILFPLSLGIVSLFRQLFVQGIIIPGSVCQAPRSQQAVSRFEGQGLFQPRLPRPLPRPLPLFHVLPPPRAGFVTGTSSS